MKLRIKKLGTLFLLANLYLLVINCSCISNQDSSQNSTPGKIDIAVKCKEIRDAWAGQNGWNDSLYHALRDDIDQSKSMKLLTEDAYNTLNKALRVAAAGKAYEGYLNALHATPFSDADLQRNYKGVKVLAQAEHMGNDPQVSHIMQLHELYTNISSFIASNHAITADFDTYHEKWDSFVKKQEIVLTQAREFSGDTLYSELSHLPGFREGLDEAKLKDATNAFRETFYNDLSNQIVTHFNSKGITQSNYNMLYQIYRNFLYEEMNHGADNIANCLRQWKKELEEN